MEGWLDGCELGWLEGWLDDWLLGQEGCKEGWLAGTESEWLNFWLLDCKDSLSSVSLRSSWMARWI